MGTKGLRLVPLTWRSICNHRGAFHPSNSYRVSFSLPGLPVTATPVGLALRATRDCQAGDVGPGHVTARAGTRDSDTRFTSSPTYPPGQNGKPGTGARAAPSQLCKGTRARVTYPSSGRRVERAMG